VRDETVTTRRTEEADRRDEAVKAADRAMADAMPGAVGPNVRRKLAEAAVDATSRGSVAKENAELRAILQALAYPDPMTTRREICQAAREALDRLGEH
jgi:hypothetical protein